LKRWWNEEGVEIPLQAESLEGIGESARSSLWMNEVILFRLTLTLAVVFFHQQTDTQTRGMKLALHQADVETGSLPSLQGRLQA